MQQVFEPNMENAVSFQGRTAMGRAAVAAAVATVLMLPAGQAQAGWRDSLGAAVEATRDWATELAIGAETAVVAGGIVLHRYRHTVAGGMIGCVAGAAVGTTVSAGAGLATGGAALAATGPAAALGCGVGAAYGASLGYPLDTMYDLP